MTATAPHHAAPVDAAEVDPALPGAVGGRRPAHAAESTRGPWVAVIAVLLLATAVTTTLLMVQWMATSSGTVAR